VTRHDTHGKTRSDDAAAIPGVVAAKEGKKAGEQESPDDLLL